MRTRMIVSLLCLPLVNFAVPAATITVVDLPAIGTDAAMDIDSDKTYTHTFDFGLGTPVTINGVAFEQGPAGGISSAYSGTSIWGYGYTLESTASGVVVDVHAGNDNIDADGNAAGLLRDMIYHSGGPVGEGTVLTLSDLMPATTYSTRWYFRAYATGANRLITFQADGESPGVFSDTFEINIDAGGAHYLDYTFTADNTDVTIRFITHHDNMSAHIYGLSNEVVGLPSNASNPSPVAGQKDVPRDTKLHWHPGQFAHTHDVYLGTVFDDVNEASRADPRGVLVSQGQSGTAYAPVNPLEYSQRYYWRIDEVNAPPDSTIYRGDVWSFTVEPFAYPVANIVATSNGDSDAGAGPERTVDGSGLNDENQHSTDSVDMWLALAQDEPVYIQYEFDRMLKLHEMLVWNYNVQFEMLLGFGVKDVTIEYSADGQEWAVLGDYELAQATARSTYTANTTIRFDGVAARYVRLTANSSWGGADQFGLSEVRFLYVPAQAREPQPGDGAVNVAVDRTLAWRAGRDAVSHEVYFGTEPETLTLIETVAGNSYTPGALDLGTTYYWQVNAVQEAELWPGELWSFATQEYLLVDGFESYTDDIDAGEAIFDTWIDGWVNDTGSTVGHLETPFAERSVVRSGSQSMPLYYDNTTISYSEATVNVADLQVGQDWTRYGIEALTLYFYGDPANSAEQMYVKLNGAKVLYDGDADDLKQTLWRPWSVDLADFGVDLRNVRELSMGFERIGATGGTGVVYFDDIRLGSAVSPAGRFSIGPWTGDEDSGIHSDKVYTHTGKFSGEGVDGEPFFAGNGVYFERDTNGSGTHWTLTGPATNVFDTTNPVNVTGDSAALARGFFYGDQDDNHPVLTLTALVPGTRYVTTFYTVGFGGAGGRFTDITPGDDPKNPTRIDQNGAGSGNGQLIRYTYVAAGTEMSFVFDALVTGDSWHHYAFSNEVAEPN